MLKIAMTVVVGGALVLASDPASARFRVRVSTPAPKPVAVQPSKAAAAATTTSRPSVGVFVPLRPFAAAPRQAPVQRAAPALAHQAGASDVGAAAGGDRSAPVALHAAHGSANDQEPAKAPAVATPSTAEPAKARPAPGFAPARLASTTSVQMANHNARPARAPIYCYVQPSGACVPF